jgi:transposase
MPRPTKLTKPAQARIVAAAAAGNTRRVCALAAGISDATLYDWISRGKRGEASYLEFLESLRLAEAKAEMNAVAVWQEAMPGNWQAARDFLARRWPEDWGTRDRHEHTGPEGGPITMMELALRAREAREEDGEAA